MADSRDVDFEDLRDKAIAVYEGRVTDDNVQAGVKVIYIAGPFRGANAWEVEQNIRRAEDLAYRVAELGAMPVCPHAITRHTDGFLPEHFWLNGTMELMRRCDAVIFTDDWERSEGARGERAEATRIGLPRFYEIEDLETWIRGDASMSITRDRG